MKRTKPQGLNDRERILMEIIRGLAMTQCLRPHAAGQWSSEPYWDQFTERYRVHFAPWKSNELKRGDLVIGKSARSVHEWLIGFYVEPLAHDYGGAVIREIGSDRLCDYSNEIFEPIIGLSKTQLLEGEAYQFYQKVLRAFAKGGEYTYRFGGVDFSDDGVTATIWVREVFGGITTSDGEQSVPFAVNITWDKRTSVKRILTTMREQGYGTKAFERRPVVKKEGATQ